MDALLEGAGPAGVVEGLDLALLIERRRAAVADGDFGRTVMQALLGFTPSKSTKPPCSLRRQVYRWRPKRGPS